MSNITIKDSVVFVTGANRKNGIGRALVNEALNRGAKKVYATGRDSSQLADLEKNERVVAVELDITNKEQIQKVAKEAQDVQILINNSGIAEFSGAFFNYKEDSFKREVDVNVFGTLHVSQEFIPSLIKNGNAALVNVISIAGLTVFPQGVTYSASKAALHSVTQGLRAELAPQGVSVFGVYPGPIDTDMTDTVEFEKESPQNAAIRVFDGIESGKEEITTDKMADDIAANLKIDAKAVEKDLAQTAHQPQTK